MIKTYYYAIDKDGQGWYYDVFKDCVIPATTFDKGPLQFEIDEQLNTTWYKE